MDWLHAGRVRGYLWLFAVLNFATLAMLVATARHGVDRNGFLLGSDFISFWTAGRMLAAGAPVYDVAAHIAWQRAWFAAPGGYTAFFYPPTFLPLCRPLALLGYFPALAGWLLLTGALYVAAARVWLRNLGIPVPTWLLVLAFPAAPIVVTHGQTAFLVAGLLGLGLWLVPRRPWLAGVLIGLAAIKPQFGPLVALGLLVSGEGRVIAGAAIGAALLAGGATLAFGPAIWPSWLAASARAQVAMEAGAVPFAKMITVFAAARLAGLGTTLAYLVQGGVTLGVAGGVGLAARRGWSVGLAALVLAGAPLATPFALDYDLVLLAFPLIWLAARGLATGFRYGEKLALLLAFAAPAFARPVALATGLSIAPPVLALLFAVLLLRMRREAVIAALMRP